MQIPVFATLPAVPYAIIVAISAEALQIHHQKVALVAMNVEDRKKKYCNYKQEALCDLVHNTCTFGWRNGLFFGWTE